MGNLASAVPVRRERDSSVSPDMFRQLTIVLIFAALLEALLLRGAVRVGVHLPKDAAVRGPFEAASTLGSLSFNFASILAIALVGWLIASIAIKEKNPLTKGVLLTLGTATLSGLALTLATDEPASDALFGVASATLVVALLAVTLSDRRLAPAAMLAVALVAAAYLSYQYYALSYLFYRILDYAAVPPLSMSVLRLGELLALAGGLAAFAAWGLSRWRYVGLLGFTAICVTVLALTLAALAPASTMSILALWTSGLSLTLPWPLYSLTLGLYLATVVACWRSDDGFWLAAGLLLVMLAGYMAESTYHHLLLLLAVGFLTRMAPNHQGHSGASAREHQQILPIA